MTEEYYIFSDESGHWTHEGFYIRSWVSLSEENYLKLKGKMSLFKGMNSINRELKFNEYHDYTIFSDLDFKVYFTITINQDFKERSFNIITHLNGQNDDLFTMNRRNVKNRIIASIKNTLFLNIFEYHHLENAINYFKGIYSNNKLNFIIDTPQYHKKHWTEIFKELRPNCNFNIKIVSRSENFEGIQFADILSGNLNKILKSIDTFTSPNKFENKIISNFSQENGATDAFKNNPQIVMWQASHQEFVDKIKNLMDE